MPTGLILAFLVVAEVGVPAPKTTREQAIALIDAGQFAEGADRMRDVSRDPALTPEQRSSAAQIAVNAYARAFQAAPDPRPAAELLCRGLAVADEFVQLGGAAAASIRAGRDHLLALRQPHGACPPPPTSELLPVLPERRPPPIPTRAVAPTAKPSPVRVTASDPDVRRRARALRISGGVLTGLGLGLGAGLTAVLVQNERHAEDMRGILHAAKIEGRGYTQDEERRYGESRAALLQGQAVGAALGVVGAVSLTTGIALLATRHKLLRSRAYTLLPYAGPQHAGAVLRLRF